MQKILIHTIGFGLLFLFLSCGSKEVQSDRSSSDENTRKDSRIFVSKAQFDSSNMSLGSLSDQSFSVTVQVSGMIDVPPENRAVVTATTGGYIKTTPLLIGDKVSRGQGVVTIENPEFVSLQQQYLEVHEQLRYLEAEYERQKTMRAENITSDKRFLQAESSFKTARARHSGLGKQLQMLNISPERVAAGNIQSIVTIYAPITGSVTKVNVTKGAYVSPATDILEIVDNRHIHLELAVFEKDIMQLEKGQSILFKIPESSPETFKATVHLIGTVITENRTIKVHGHLEDETAANFITGMFVEAAIVTETAFAKALPETAVVAMGEQSWALKLSEKSEDGYFFEQIAVDAGPIAQGYIAIDLSNSLSLEDIFLTRGAFTLLDDE